MVQEFLTVLGTIVGTVAGAITGFLLNEYKTRKDKDNQIKSARMLIRLEIDKNLEMLSELWDTVTKIDPDKKNSNALDLAYNLVDLNLPPWKNESWISQLSFLPIALNEDKIKDINELYNDFDIIKSIYSSLWYLNNKDEEDIRSRQTDYVYLTAYTAFNEGAPELWKKFEEITLKLLENRNPLNEK